jgi:hypothetical protein
MPFVVPVMPSAVNIIVLPGVERNPHILIKPEPFGGNVQGSPLPSICPPVGGTQFGVTGATGVGATGVGDTEQLLITTESE